MEAMKKSFVALPARTTELLSRAGRATKDSQRFTKKELSISLFNNQCSMIDGIFCPQVQLVYTLCII